MEILDATIITPAIPLMATSFRIDPVDVSVAISAYLVTVAVLIRQNRMAQVAEHRAHLDLQINMLTEQKVTKLLQILDAPRRADDARADPAR